MVVWPMTHIRGGELSSISRQLSCVHWR